MHNPIHILRDTGARQDLSCAQILSLPLPAKRPLVWCGFGHFRPVPGLSAGLVKCTSCTSKTDTWFPSWHRLRDATCALAPTCRAAHEHRSANMVSAYMTSVHLRIPADTERVGQTKHHQAKHKLIRYSSRMRSRGSF